MKERVEKINPTEIVLSDNELMLEIQKIIEVAIKKGYTKTSVINAISQRWRDMAPKQEKKEFELTDDEKAFFEKVDKFYSECGQAFVVWASWRENGRSWRNKDDIEERANDHDYVEKILSSLKASTKSIYCIFGREDKITRQIIQKYSKKLFDFSYCFDYFDPFYVDYALSDLCLVNGKPTYILDREERRKYYTHSINNNENYWEFIHKYLYRDTALNRAAMQLIWVISTYY